MDNATRRRPSAKAGPTGSRRGREPFGIPSPTHGRAAAPVPRCPLAQPPSALPSRSITAARPRCHRTASARYRPASVQVVAQDLGTGRVAQLRHGLTLYLPNSLPGDAVDLADLVEGLGLAVGETEPHRDHAGLALGERVEHRVQLLLEQGEAHGFARLDRLGVLDEVAELGVAVLAQRSVQ